MKGNIGDKHQSHFLKGKEIQITRKEDGLIPLYRDLDASTRNLKGRKMHPIKIERRIHFSTCGNNGNVEKVFYKKRDILRGEG
jgi:hypothetical protein